MTMRKTFVFVSVLLAMISCVGNEQLPDKTESEPSVEETEYVQGVAEVYFTDEMAAMIEDDLAKGGLVTKSAQVNTLIADLGITSMERLFPDAGEYEARSRAEGLHRWYRIEYENEQPVTKAADIIATVPGVEIVEPVRRIHQEAFFNDTYLPKQWHYYNDGTMSDNHKAGADVNVLPVWANYTTGSSNVVVAIVDSGIDQKHEDLAAACIGGYNFVTNSSKIVASEHGTHVAGTIGAINNNGKGVSGIAGGDAKAKKAGVRLLSCQIFQDGTDDSGSGAQALKWACDNGANIANNSWGYEFKTLEEAKNSRIPASLVSAIDYFIKYAGCDANGSQKPDSPMKGGVVFFSAGNGAYSTDPIGLYEPVISVGSIGPDFSRAYYSNYGDWVDICTPGGDYKLGTNAEIYSTLPDNKYGWMQGTSMACPHASGVAALVLSYCGGQGFTAEALRTKMIKGANTSAVKASAKIGPLVDALGAITYGGTIPPDKVLSADVTSVSNNIDVTFKVTADEDDRKAYGYMVLAAKEKSLLSSVDPDNIPAGVVSRTVEVGNANVGDEITARVPGLEFNTSYFVGIMGYDYVGNFSAMSPVWQVTTKANNPPVISTDYEGDFRVRSFESLVVRYNVSDPDGHMLTVNFENGSAADQLIKYGETEYRLQIDGSAVDSGTYTARMTAVDSYGLSTTLDVTYVILENQPPVVIKHFEDSYSEKIGDTFSVLIADYIMDPDGEVLTWTVDFTTKNVFHANIVRDVLYGTVMGVGQTEVTVTGTDAKGKSASTSFRVFVKDPSDVVEVYPVPCTDVLNVRTGELAGTRVRIFSEGGNAVYDKTEEIGVFNPSAIDVSGLAPGRYVVRVEISGKDVVEKRIVKI